MRMNESAAIWAALVLSGLVLLGCGNSVERSIKKLGADKKEDRDQALMELMLAKGKVIPRLIEALADEQRPTAVRVDLVEALFRMYVRESDQRIVPALLAHTDDPAPEVRARVAIALADAGAEEAIGPLLERLASETDPHVRDEVLTSLDILGKWESEGSVLTVKGGESMTDEQREAFIELLKGILGQEEHKGLKDKAEELLEKFAQQMIQEADKWVLKADLVRAEETYLQAKALVPNSVNVNHTLGKFYFVNGWRDKGLRMLEDLGMVLHAARLKESPTIDGDLDDEVWKDAAKITQFYQCVPSMRVFPAEGRSEAYVGYDDQTLYVGVKGYEESTSDLAAVFKKRDDPAWRDDCAEIYMDTNLDFHTHYQVIVNSIGTIDDYAYADESVGYRAGHDWNGTYTVATEVEEQFWTLEIAIPFSEVTRTEVKKGTTWGFNVARVRIAHKGEHDQWVPTLGDANRPSLFGLMIFD